MSTRLTDTADGVVVETVAAFYGKKRMAFWATLVPGGREKDVRKEAERQAEAIRALLIIRKPAQVPVV